MGEFAHRLTESYRDFAGPRHMVATVTTKGRYFSSYKRGRWSLGGCQTRLMVSFDRRS